MAVQGKRQSEYPTRESDALDKVLACENPDPAGDASLPARVTAQIPVAGFSGKASIQTGNYTLQNNNEIVLVDTTNGPASVTVPAGWPADSKFTVTKITDDNNLVGIVSATELFMPTRFAGPPIPAVSIFFQGENLTYVKQTTPDVWYISGGSVDSFLEIWTVPPDTPILEITPVPIPMTFALDPIGSAESRLWDDAGGVLTAKANLTLTVDVQAPVWIFLGSNNSTAQVALLPQTNGIGIMSPVWCSTGAPRADPFPMSISGSFLLKVSAGETFQIDSVLNVPIGSALADLGNTEESPGVPLPYPDTWGSIISFTLG